MSAGLICVRLWSLFQNQPQSTECFDFVFNVQVWIEIVQHILTDVMDIQVSKYVITILQKLIINLTDVFPSLDCLLQNQC